MVSKVGLYMLGSSFQSQLICLQLLSKFCKLSRFKHRLTFFFTYSDNPHWRSTAVAQKIQASSQIAHRESHRFDQCASLDLASYRDRVLNAGFARAHLDQELQQLLGLSHARCELCSSFDMALVANGRLMIGAPCFPEKLSLQTASCCACSASAGLGLSSAARGPKAGPEMLRLGALLLLKPLIENIDLSLRGLRHR